ncbi:hypothetical protein BC830DRAFT_1113784 [Chytriomyces sp. MP71]|nr:hypothetical protein BC830DRAFT_1113784 [Chytriomyces sp. MP71]
MGFRLLHVLKPFVEFMPEIQSPDRKVRCSLLLPFRFFGCSPGSQLERAAAVLEALQ